MAFLYLLKTRPFDVLLLGYFLWWAIPFAKSSLSLSPSAHINSTLVTARYSNENRNVSCSKANEKFTWPTAQQIAARERQFKLQRMISERSELNGWDPNDPGSNTRFKDIIDSLPASVRKALLNQTRPDDIEKSDLLLLDSVTLAALQKQFSRTLSNKQLAVILENMLDKQRYRQAAQVLEGLGERFASMGETVTTLVKDYSFAHEKQRCTPDNQAFIRQALRLLMPPEKWNWTVVRKFGPGMLANLPLDLIMKIRDPQASGLVLDEWLSTTIDFFGCAPVTSQTREARFWIDHITNRRRVQVKLLYTNLGEDVRKWSPAALNRYGSLLPFLTPRVLELIDGRVAVESASALSSLMDLSDSQGFALVENLVLTDSTGLKGFDSNTLGSAMSRLGSLGVYLLPEFFNVSDGVRLNFLSVWAEKLDRLAEGFENFPRWTASSLLQYRLLGAENYVTITSLLNAFSTTLDASFVKVASWSYFKLLLNQSGASNIFTQDLLRKLANSLAAEDLLPGQIKRLGPLAIQRFRRGRYWDITSTPCIYWGGTSLSDWILVSGKEIRLVIDQVNLAAKYLRPWQLALIYNKLKDDDYDFGDLKSAQVIKALVPVHQLKTLTNLESLKSIARDMPPDSTIGLLYSSTKFRDHILVEGIFRERYVGSNINADYIESIPLYQISSLLEILTSLPHGPSIQAMRALHGRLKDYIKIRRAEISSSDVSLLENTWMSNLNIYPAYALVWYSSEAVQRMSANKKIELLRSIGRLSMLDYYSIPKKVRLTLLEQGLTAMGKVSEGWLSEEDLAVLGIALVDLSREALERLLPRAFEYSLPLLQGEAEIYEGVTARPCLSMQQRAAVRKNLKRVFGSPSSWNYGIVKAACCSLDTLTESELQAIRDDLILVSCQGCAADETPLLHLQHLRQRIETACLFELGSQGLENGLLLGKKRVMRRRSKAAMNTYRGGRVRTIGVNNQYFDMDRSMELNCDVVVAAGSGAGFSVEEIYTLPDEAIQDCLYELGFIKLSSDQAAAIFNRTLQVYKNVTFIPKYQSMALGWVLSALNESMIRSLNLESEDVIAELGSSNWLLGQQQMEALASNAITQYNKSMSEYTGLDLMVLGRILCGINASLINEVPTVSYVQASAFLGVTLGQPGWCSTEVLFAFGRKALQSTAFGPPNKWTAAVVRNVGAIIGGLSPEELRALPAHSLQGLTPASVSNIEPNSFQAFKREQLLSFPLATAQAIVMDQRHELIDEMRNALNYVIFANTDSCLSVYREQGLVVVFLSFFTLVAGDFYVAY